MKYVGGVKVSFGGDIVQSLQERLVEVEVVTDLWSPAEAYLRIHDPNHIVASKCRIGVDVDISVRKTEKSHIRIFTGEITRMETIVERTLSEQGSFSVLRAMDRTHRLMRGRQVRAYQGKTLKSIVQEVAGRAGLKVGRVDDPDMRALPYVDQTNMSDWELLQHLARERGLVVKMMAKDELSLRRRQPASTAPNVKRHGNPRVLVRGENLCSLRAQVHSLSQVDEVQVTGWDPASKKPLKKTLAAPDASRAAVAKGASPAECAKVFDKGSGKSTLRVTSPPHHTDQEVTKAAAVVAEEVAASCSGFEAVVDGTPQLRAGSTVTLAGVGAPFVGKYSLTWCRQVVDSAGYRTEVGVSPPPRPGIQPAVAPLMAQGVMVGEVMDVKPHGGRYGDVRLRFPGLDPSYKTDWVPTLQDGGSKGGGFFPREIGDIVYVGFEQGRLNRPVVLGGVYRGKDAPSEDPSGKNKLPLIAADGHVNRRVLASRAGDRIELRSPKTGVQGVLLASGSGQSHISAVLDRGAQALTLTAGEGKDQVRVCLDHQGASLRLAIGQGKDQMAVLLDRKKKTLKLSSGAGPEIRLEDKNLTLIAEGGAISLKAASIDINATKAATMTGGKTVTARAGGDSITVGSGVKVTGSSIKLN